MTRTSLRVVLASLALFVPHVARAQAQDVVIYYHTDAIGSVRAITDANQQVLARYDYLPFGEPCGTACGTPPVQDPKRFTGQERDQETGLDYFGARYYAAGNGRFTSADPESLSIRNVFNPQCWNRYSYSLNNPLRYVDPDGQEVIAVAYVGYDVGSYGTYTLPLGHGAVVIVANDGSTQYYEYGRYEGSGPNGQTRYLRGGPPPSVQRDSSGRITLASMRNLLATLSTRAGKGHPVIAGVVETSDAEEQAMFSYLEGRVRQSTDPYSFSRNGGHNCGTLICDTLNAGGRNVATDNSYTTPAGIIERLGFSVFDYRFTYFSYRRCPVRC